MSQPPPYPFQDLESSQTLAASSSPPPANADWPAIGAFKLYTLVFVLPGEDESGEPSKVLLGLKQRGAFSGIWNGFGGKVESSDPSVLHAAARELEEEAGICATDLRYRGRVVFGGKPDEASIDMRLFSCTKWDGQITASEEMGLPVWYSTYLPATPPLTPPPSLPTSRSSSHAPLPERPSLPSRLPLLPAEMHPDAALYLPHIFAGRSIVARFDYATVQGDVSRATWNGLRRWWIGELVDDHKDASSGAQSEWPPRKQ